MQISNKEYKNKYKCILYFPLHLNDCISSMCLHDTKILIGTFMGVSQLIIINKDEINDSYSHIIKTITKVITEHISCIYINDNNNINIGISSSKIVHVDVDKVLNEQQQHEMCSMNDKCKSKSKDCTCMMANNRLLIIHTTFEDRADSPINKLNFEYENRSLSDSNNSKCGEITSTNFSVPFDFDGDRYVYIEYISKTKRKLCIYYTLTFETNSQIVVNLNESYGHISHLKLIQNDIVFIVKNLNECVIIELQTTKNILKLDTIDTFTHLGKEIIASAFYINNNNNNNLHAQITNVGDGVAINRNNGIINNEEKENTNNEGLLLNRQRTKANDEVVMSESGLKVKTNDEEKCINKIKDDVQIVTVDLEGNVNMFYQGEENMLFNIYEMDDIDKELKDKMMFEVGYPYYVAVNDMFLVITTDYGVLVFAKQENDVI